MALPPPPPPPGPVPPGMRAPSRLPAPPPMPPVVRGAAVPGVRVPGGPVPGGEPTTCFHHRDRATGRRCTRCGRPACPECLREASVGAQCWACVKAAAPPATERLRRWNASRRTVATNVILGLNVAVFVLGLAMGGTLLGSGPLQRDLGLFGPAVAAGEWYRLVTAGFLHYGLLHLGMNMFALYQLGLLLEPALGRVRFAALYLAALLAGSAGALLLRPDALTVGASGAVFGLFGAAAVGLRQRGVPVMRTGIGQVLVFNLVFTFVASAFISVGGHLGGLAGGAAVGALMLRPRRRDERDVLGLPVAVLVGAASVVVAYLVVAG